MFWNMLLKLAANLYYFALHVTGAGSFPPPLSAKEEEELLLKSRGGDMAARDQLIEHNLRLVAHIVKKYYHAGADQDDLISIGTIGLIKAVSTYQSAKGTHLATYASRCIENAILSLRLFPAKIPLILPQKSPVLPPGQTEGLVPYPFLSHRTDPIFRFSLS